MLLMQQLRLLPEMDAAVLQTRQDPYHDMAPDLNATLNDVQACLYATELLSSI